MYFHRNLRNFFDILLRVCCKIAENMCEKMYALNHSGGYTEDKRSVARGGGAGQQLVEHVHVARGLEVLAHERRVGHAERSRREVVALEEVGEGVEHDELVVPEALVRVRVRVRVRAKVRVRVRVRVRSP